MCEQQHVAVLHHLKGAMLHYCIGLLKMLSAGVTAPGCLDAQSLQAAPQGRSVDAEFARRSPPVPAVALHHREQKVTLEFLERRGLVS